MMFRKKHQKHQGHVEALGRNRVTQAIQADIWQLEKQHSSLRMLAITNLPKKEQSIAE